MRYHLRASESVRKPQEFGRACDCAAGAVVCAQYMCMYRVWSVAASKPIRASGKGRGDRGTATQSRRGGVSAERRVFTRTWVTVRISQVSSTAWPSRRCCRGANRQSEEYHGYRIDGRRPDLRIARCDVVPAGARNTDLDRTHPILPALPRGLAAADIQQRG